MKRASWLGIGSSACMVLASRSRRSSRPTVTLAVLDEREGVRRIERDRCEDRQVAGQEFLFEPLALGRRELLGFDNEDARRCHLGLERVPAGLLIADQDGGEAIDLGELLSGRQAVLARLHDPGVDLSIEARGSHHVEFIEVGRGYGQKAQALEQRVAEVVRLLQDAAIELQPGQLAIEIARRTSGRCRAARAPRSRVLFLSAWAWRGSWTTCSCRWKPDTA